jgi:NAD(P)-dependent dehydrogenase (short-subunit alcohol dehydrogenase family)
MEKLVVLITGTSTGFGHLTALKLAEEGHIVYATMRNTQGKNANAAQKILDFAQKGNYSLSVLDLDVQDENSVNNAVATIQQEQGRIDVLINNAGIWGPGALEAFTMEQWKEHFDINFFGAIRMIRAVAPIMRHQNNGLMISISSLQARFVLPYGGPNLTTKWALDAASNTFHYELAPFGVEVCIVQPYDFMTEMKQKAVNHVAQDTQRQKEYGIDTFVQQMYLTPNAERAGNPIQVVDTIQKLIAMPKGERPLRTTINSPMPQIDEINRLTDEMHNQLYPYIGLSHLLTIKNN